MWAREKNNGVRGGGKEGGTRGIIIKTRTSSGCRSVRNPKGSIKREKRKKTNLNSLEGSEAKKKLNMPSARGKKVKMNLTQGSDQASGEAMNGG